MDRPAIVIRPQNRGASTAGRRPRRPMSCSSTTDTMARRDLISRWPDAARRRRAVAHASPPEYHSGGAAAQGRSIAQATARNPRAGRGRALHPDRTRGDVERRHHRERAPSPRHLRPHASPCSDRDAAWPRGTSPSSNWTAASCFRRTVRWRKRRRGSITTGPNRDWFDRRHRRGFSEHCEASARLTAAEARCRRLRHGIRLSGPLDGPALPWWMARAATADDAAAITEATIYEDDDLRNFGEAPRV